VADPKNPNVPVDPEGTLPQRPDSQGTSEPTEAGPLEELHLAGPLEDLDFSESSGFSFPTEAAAAGEAPAEALPADAETAEFMPEVALPGGEPAAEAELAQEGLPEAGEASAEPPEGEAEPAETSPAPKRRKWLAHVDWVGVALLAIAIWLVVQAVTVNVAWITGYLVLLVLIPFALWKTRNRWMTPQITAVYTVLLAISTAALLTAVFWLGLELAQYHWDVKAKTRPVVGAVEMGLGIRD
jgi:cation transport ATPase